MTGHKEGLRSQKCVLALMHARLLKFTKMQLCSHYNMTGYVVGELYML